MGREGGGRPCKIESIGAALLRREERRINHGSTTRTKKKMRDRLDKRHKIDDIPPTCRTGA